MNKREALACIDSRSSPSTHSTSPSQAYHYLVFKLHQRLRLGPGTSGCRKHTLGRCHFLSRRHCISRVPSCQHQHRASPGVTVTVTATAYRDRDQGTPKDQGSSFCACLFKSPSHHPAHWSLPTCSVLMCCPASSRFHPCNSTRPAHSTSYSCLCRSPYPP